MGRESFDVEVIEHTPQERRRLHDAMDDFFAERDYYPVPEDLTLEDEDED